MPPALEQGPPREPPYGAPRPEVERFILTVTEAAQRVRRIIEDSFPPLWVIGEVSNARRPRSGHLYFSLKDGRSLINVVMFRNAIQRQGAGVVDALKDGMEVLVHGALSVYERDSGIQVIADRVEAHGQGALELQREELRRRFEAAGLFAPSRKRPLPRFPQRIGIVTSPTGAAIRDILTTLDRRWPRLHVIIAPVRVQGEGAAEQVGEAIDALNRLHPQPELIIVSRGGGSVEHLWPFNLEPVVLAIGRSERPVVTGIGHEVDETLADLAADLRVPTPTAAAEAITPVLEEQLELLGEMEMRLRRAMRLRLREARQRLSEVEARYGFRAIRDVLERKGRELDEVSERFDRAIRDRLRQARDRLQAVEAAYGFRAPSAQLERHRRLLGELGPRLHSAIGARLARLRERLEAAPQARFEASLRRRVEAERERLAQAAARLDALSPLKVLSRGYAIAQHEGKVVRRADELTAGDEVTLRFGEGRATARIETIQEDEDDA